MNIQKLLSDNQLCKLSLFLNEQRELALERQKKEIKNPGAHIKECWDMGYPYEGAIGGSITYELTPTSLGTVIKVKTCGQEIDLTEYENW